MKLHEYTTLILGNHNDENGENCSPKNKGIPTIEDRLIQQCILQVMEPICEAKFHKHSYGFRPNRNTHHAISRFRFLAFTVKLEYVVDIDIKGFFDNVDHSKLLKQIWSLGIHDKNLLCVISKLLKAPIQGEGVPSKGTPQGGLCGAPHNPPYADTFIMLSQSA